MGRDGTETPGEALELPQRQRGRKADPGTMGADEGTLALLADLDEMRKHVRRRNLADVHLFGLLMAKAREHDCPPLSSRQIMTVMALVGHVYFAQSIKQTRGQISSAKSRGYLTYDKERRGYLGTERALAVADQIRNRPETIKRPITTSLSCVLT
jgi:hypothetical protein